MFLLAQAAPDLIKPWLEVFFWLAGGIGAVLACIVAVKSLRAPDQVPQPLEVREHAAHATRDELATVKTEVHGRLKREREEINEQIRRVEQAAADRADKLDDKLDRNTELTAATRGEVKLMNQQLAQVLTKLLK